MIGLAVCAVSEMTGVDGVNGLKLLSFDSADECALDMSELGGVRGATIWAGTAFWIAVTGKVGSGRLPASDWGMRGEKSEMGGDTAEDEDSLEWRKDPAGRGGALARIDED